MAAQSVNVLITGANRGLGLEMVGQLVQGSVPVKKLIACCRDPDGPRAQVSPGLLFFLLSTIFRSLQFCSALACELPGTHHNQLFCKHLKTNVSRPFKRWRSSILMSSRLSVWVRVHFHIHSHIWMTHPPPSPLWDRAWRTWLFV